MTQSGWQDRIVGVRMRVDGEFQSEVEASGFSRQQWGLVMTAVEFDLENPEDPESARLVADTSKVKHVVPELENVDQQMAAMGGGSGGGSSSGGGFLASVKSALGLGGGDDADAAREREAVDLAEEYARMLETELKENGRWDEVCEAAARDAADAAE